jgi:hypothetical protein
VAHVLLKVGPMRDVRARISGNDILFRSENETTIDDVAYCVNAEAGYKPNTVGTQVAEALAQHLRQRGSFRAVSAGARVNHAYYLSATLRRFYAAQKSTSTSPTMVFLFGPVAVITWATTPATTPGIVSIELVDWKLYNGRGQLVASLPDVIYNKQLELPAATNCMVVYDNINERLRLVFGKYVHTIERALADAERDLATRGSAD